MVTKKTDTPETDDVWADEVPPNFNEPADPNRDLLTISIKAGGLEGAWIVGHFNSVREAIDTLSDDDDDYGVEYTFDELTRLVNRRSKAFQQDAGFSKPQPASKASGGGGWAGKSSGASKRSSAPEDSEGGECRHGEREFKSGTKNGKSWAGWFCPDNRDGCKPVWDN